MTTVRNTQPTTHHRRSVGGMLCWAVLACSAVAAPAFGQDRPVHWRHAGAMPPGAIGRQRLMRGGPLSGYSQPVEIRVPNGTRIAPAIEQNFGEPTPDRLLVGLQIGPVYRFRVTDIAEEPGLEIFPTVEMIDRMYPPEGQSLKFPVPVDIMQDELLMAAEGKFITRVIYLEDPQLAIPIAEKTPSPTRWMEVRAGGDPLVTADNLGRPIAILRMGGRVPEPNQVDDAFLYCSPPMLVYDQHLQPVAAEPTEPMGESVILTPHEMTIEPLNMP